MSNKIQHHCTRQFFISFDSGNHCKGAKVLDSGCGDGFASKTFLIHKAHSIYAYDPDLKTDGLHQDDKIRYAKQLPVTSDTFDIFWSHHVIEHVNDPVAYLHSFRKYSRLKSELWLGCPNTMDLSVFSLGHIHNFTIANLVLVLQRANLGVRDMRWYLTPGQIRVRVPIHGGTDLPDPFLQQQRRNKHFRVKDLPQNWRWNNEK